MSKADDHHFDAYPPQTRAKHRILAGYLPAYLTALKNRSDRFIYVDGFAGPGVYVEGNEEFQGSPLLALDLVSKNVSLRGRVDLLFVESKDAYFKELQSRVDAFLRSHPEAPRPECIHGKFSEKFAGSDTASRQKRFGAATFMFIDPCGVDGIEMSAVASILSQPKCELFLFFNSNGIERIVGAAAKSGKSPTLDTLLGSSALTTHLIKRVESLGNESVDEIALAAYREALQAQTGVRFVLPLRVEFADRRDTSHYLIHASKDCLGFKIMKHVMLDAARAGAGDEERLEFMRASSDPTGSLFGVDAKPAEEDVVGRLTQGPREVASLISELVCRPTDYHSEGYYKRLICDLELNSRLSVFENRECTLEKPRAKRMRPNRKTGVREATLGNQLWLRLR